MCRVFSCVVGRGCLLSAVHFLGKTLLVLPCFIPHFKAKFSCYSGCFLTSYFSIPVHYNEKDIFFWYLVLKGLAGLHRTIQLQLLQCYWLGHRFGLPWYWIVCLGNKRRPFCHFWDCIQVLLSESFFDHDGYSISSKGFLRAVVDIMVFDCVDHNKLENSERDENTRPPDLPLEKFVCRSRSNS